MKSAVSITAFSCIFVEFESFATWSERVKPLKLLLSNKKLLEIFEHAFSDGYFVEAFCFSGKSFVKKRKNVSCSFETREILTLDWNIDIFFDRTYDIFGIFRLKMADLNEQDLLDYDEEEQEVKDIKQKKDVKVKFLKSF